MKKTYKKFDKMKALGFILIIGGFLLALYFYLFPIMPGITLRKIFYVIALIAMVKGAFLMEKAYKLEKRYKARVRAALIATKRRR